MPPRPKVDWQVETPATISGIRRATSVQVAKFDSRIARVETEENHNSVPSGRSMDISKFGPGAGQRSQTLEVDLSGPRRSRTPAMMDVISRSLTSVVVVLTLEAQAVDQGVNLQYVPYTTSLESPEDEPFEFWDRFKVSFDQQTDEQFADRFHPLKLMDWSVELANRDSERFHERTASAARHAFSRSAVNGVREATVDLPIMLWLKESQGFLANLLRNSVGNVEEEAVAPVDPSYGLVERSWWRRLSEGGAVRYGLRPFRTDPYAFLSLAVKDGDTLIVLTHVRYHYRLFGDHYFEMALSLPLSHGFAISLGTSYEFGRYGEEQKTAVKLVKELKSGGIMHLGLEAKEHPTLLAGITFPL